MVAWVKLKLTLPRGLEAHNTLVVKFDRIHFEGRILLYHYIMEYLACIIACMKTRLTLRSHITSLEVDNGHLITVHSYNG